MLDSCGAVTCGECDTSFVYNTSEYQSTTVTDFDLVCEQAYIVDWIMMVILMGAVVGALSGGYLNEESKYKELCVSE